MFTLPIFTLSSVVRNILIATKWKAPIQTSSRIKIKTFPTSSSLRLSLLCLLLGPSLIVDMQRCCQGIANQHDWKSQLGFISLNYRADRQTAMPYIYCTDAKATVSRQKRFEWCWGWGQLKAVVKASMRSGKHMVCDEILVSSSCSLQSCWSLLKIIVLAN